MDLNHALNLNQPVDKYFDVNNNVNKRIFDITPKNIMYEKNQLPAFGNQIPLANENGSPSYQNYSQSSQQQSRQTEMSPQYLQMKHVQEQQTLLERSDMNPDALQKLKIHQALELQKNLQYSDDINRPNGIDCFQTFHAKPTMNLNIGQIYGCNAQGESVSNSQSMYQDNIKRSNKYQQLKQMSPEMLNQAYGRQSNQSVLPPPYQIDTSDIYDQTSCPKTSIKVPQRSHDQLKIQLDQRRKEIMAQKSAIGIQSYKDCQGFGTNLNDAFISY